MYILFAGHLYYASGGARDFVGVFDTVEQAKTAFAKDTQDWAHIARLHDGDLLKAGDLTIEWEYAEFTDDATLHGWWNTSEYSEQIDLINSRKPSP